MIRTTLGLLLALTLASSLFAQDKPADQGKVIWKERRCSFFIVQTPWGYALFEHLNGPWPNDDDVYEGKMEGFGTRNLVNKTQGDQITLTYSEVSSTSKKWVANKIPGFCKRKKEFVAQVEAETAGQNPAPLEEPAKTPAPNQPGNESKP
ncbi:MAG TPA: hypothetical protein VFB54_03375 [Burkholderiales bacterium]|nr:hypothetical protein [Burkholderiales bacterium]